MLLVGRCADIFQGFFCLEKGLYRFALACIPYNFFGNEAI